MSRLPMEPFKIKAVEPIHFTTRQERLQALQAACFNLFAIPSDKILIDLLTDSGTSAMSDNQWAGMMLGDESYAGSRNFTHFVKTVQDIFGFEHIIPTHQGRAAENLLFTALLKAGMCVPSNSHFDTTRAHIETRGAEAADCAVPEAYVPEAERAFKGDMDLKRLEVTIKRCGREKIPLAMVVVTNNTIGGQPVSMKNIRETRQLLEQYRIPLYIDACRYAENAYFIKEQESGYQAQPIRAIVKEMFSYADGCLMSGKKDGLVNIGGFIATHDAVLAERLKQLLILTEGFPTYGGLARRDLEAMARGLEEALDENYLRYRIEQVRYLGNRLIEVGVPIVKPVGGHAIYLDARRFLPHVPLEQFPAQTLACALYVEGGIRPCELGGVAFPRKKDALEGNSSSLELVRLAIPRRVYTVSHLDYVAETILQIYKNRHAIRGLRLTYEAPFLRHFTARFESI